MNHGTDILVAWCRRYDDVRAGGTVTSSGDTRRGDGGSVRPGHVLSFDGTRRDSRRESDSAAPRRTGSSNVQCEIFVRNNTSYRYSRH